MDCIFCKIVAGAIPSKKIFEDERLYAFSDIDPKAPVHFLVIPKNHIAALAHATAADREMLGHLLGAAADIAAGQGLGNGYRVVINNGPDGGQTVDHLHVHVLGGRPMHWPPG